MWLLQLFLISQVTAWFYGRDAPDRWSVGGVWPLPQIIIYGKMNRTIHPEKIGFDLAEKKDCEVLRTNVKNYMNKWMFPFPVATKKFGREFIVSIRVKENCLYFPPQHGFSEKYKLRVSVKDAIIEADTVWGAIRAIETFSQLIFYNEKKGKYQVRTVDIQDWPRFPLRGLMIDSSRHFLSLKVIKRQIDLMAMNKMNILHWHLVDSEAFPYESTTFPNLSKVGAYSPRHIYSQSEVRSIINYARLRGIRVMPEFDLPGHMNSWRGQPGLLTDCLDAEGKLTYPNLFDPTNEYNFEFIKEFFNEIVSVFPEEFLHLGGDEVEVFILECWNRNPKVNEFMHRRGFGNDTLLLENYFFDKLAETVTKLQAKRNMVFWQEVFDNNNPNNQSIIHIWKGNTHEEIANKVKNVTAKGFPVIVSACWYLNYIKYGADWRDEIAGFVPSTSRYYYCDPTNFDGSEEQKKLVLGGIAVIWGEFVDDTNIESRLWPRASAAAERLWSPPEKTQKAEDAWPRMHELRCRLVARGFRVQPINNPDYCPYEFDA